MDVTRRNFGKSAAAGLAAPLLAASATKPNIVFICSDQHDGRVMGANGHPVVKTPSMDRLASMGALFRNAYCANPICCPSRASMMTGRFASDVGVYCNATAFEGRSPTWGARLRDAGYHTWATGKLDLIPNHDLGFLEVGTEHGNYIEPDITTLFRRPSCFRPGSRGEVSGGVRKRASHEPPRVERALGFLQREAPSDKPWAMYLGMEAPKSFRNGGLPEYLKLYPEDRVPMPNIPPGHLERMHLGFQRLRDFFLFSPPFPDALVRRARASYFANITEVDAIVGSILDQIEKGGRFENTIIVYTSDHGEMAGEHGMWTKGCLLEPACRVPLILAGPGIPRGARIDTPVAHVDLAATLLELAGTPVPPDARGHSLMPLMRGEIGTHPGFAFSESHSDGNITGSFMIRKGDWKYIYFYGDDPVLFNLKDDPDELHDLARDPKSAPILRDLHGVLTSLLDPDKVARQAFEEQDRRLDALVRRSTPKQFYDSIVSRLGKAQARVLTDKHYKV